MAKNKYIEVHFTPDDDIIEALAEQMQKTPGLLRAALKRQGTKFKRRILAELRVEPGAPSHPLRWKSEKQRRYVMANIDLPYDRTHAISQGWEVEIDRSRDLEFSVFNREESARFVVGEDQQPFHIDTGWIYAPRVMAKEREKFEDVLIETYFTVGDPTAGVFP